MGSHKYGNNKPDNNFHLTMVGNYFFYNTIIVLKNTEPQNVANIAKVIIIQLYMSLQKASKTLDQMEKL